MKKLEYIKGIISFLESSYSRSQYIDLLEIVCDAAERYHLGHSEDTIDLLEQSRSWIGTELKQMKEGR